MSATILCAHDGEEHSNQALGLAAVLAKAMEAEVTCLAVNVAAGGLRGAFEMTWDKAEADAVLARLGKVAKAAGLPNAKTVLATGRDPAGTIVHYAFENGYDHIVVGSGRKGALRKLFIGSVSAEVAAKAHCPVTIAR